MWEGISVGRDQGSGVEKGSGIRDQGWRRDQGSVWEGIRMVRGYRELIVWQKAMELVKMVYQLMRCFPADERFRLCDQLSRAVISVPSNIAEGNGRESKSEYARFLGIARGSLYETETQLEIAKELGYIDDLSKIFKLTSEIARMLISIISKLRT